MSDEKSTEVARVQAALANAWDALDTVKDYLRDVELEKLNNVERIEIDSSMIPEGAVLLEAYLHKGVLVVMHEEALGELGKEHNCDEMGCGTGSHVWARIPLVMSRTAELEAERDALKAELKAACTVTFEETEMGECHGEDSTVPFEEHAEAVRYAFDEAALVFGSERDWHKQGGPSTKTEWADSEAKARLDERGENKDVLVTLHNAGQGNPLHDEDPTV